MLRVLTAFLLAVIATYLLAATFSTQIILHQVAELGLPVSLIVRLDTTFKDLLGMLPMYLPFVAASLVIAIPVSALALKVVPIPRTLGFLIGGAAALWALHMIMFAAFGIHALPATRLPVGMATQALAGAVGGYVYAKLSVEQVRSRNHPRSSAH